MLGKPSVARAAIVMCGTILGAGIFALPRLVAQSGYFVGLFWMVLLAAAVAVSHLLFGEVVAATGDDHHRMVGYVGMYLGPWAKAAENISSLLGLLGGCIAYLILAGLFLQQALAPLAAVDPRTGSFLMIVFGAMAAIFGTTFIIGVDSWMACAELVAFLVLTAVAVTGIQPAHLTAVADASKAFLPYGLVLFSFGGMSAVVEVRKMTPGDPKAMRRAILIGSLLAAAVTTLFVTAVVGTTGLATTPESLAGLNARFGGAVPLLGAVTGFLSILTTYVVFTEYLKGQFHRDYGWPKWLSIILAVGVPLGLFLAGVRDFGRILELVGSVLAGVEGIFVILMYRIVRKRFPDRAMKFPTWILWALVTMYAAGALYEIVFRMFR